MKRLLLPLLVVLFMLALVAAPAMAVPGAPGPPGMMVGSYYTVHEWGMDRVQFRAGGTLEDGYGFIRYDAWPDDPTVDPYYLDFEVTSFYRLSDTRAACFGVFKAGTGGPPNTRMVLWVEDNGEGARAVGPDQWFWIYGPLLTYEPWWLTEWEYDLGIGSTSVIPLPIGWGNIQVH